MKAQIFIATVLLVAGMANAQTQKGNGIISGQVDISYQRSDLNVLGIHQSSSYTLRPQVNFTIGRFIRDNWLLGVSVGGNSSRLNSGIQRSSGQTIDYNVTNSTGAISVNPFVRRYWQLAPVQLFVGAGLGFGITGSRLETFQVDTRLPATETNSNFRINPVVEAGVNYFITNRLALQLAASANSLPVGVTSLRTGLVYWTGPDRKAGQQPQRDNSQTDKGNWLIEGSFLVDRLQNERTITAGGTRSVDNLYSFSPSVGYFVRKNTIVGVNLPISFGRTRFEDLSSASATQMNNPFWSLGISPSALLDINPTYALHSCESHLFCA